MWHEARRQDKRVKLLAGSQLKRSQQRKADEIKKVGCAWDLYP